MKKDSTAHMATPVLRLDRKPISISPRISNGLVGGTTAIFDKYNHALYFSKEIIPFFNLEQWPTNSPLPLFHHVGVYAYRPNSYRVFKLAPR